MTRPTNRMKIDSDFWVSRNEANFLCLQHIALAIAYFECASNDIGVLLKQGKEKSIPEPGLQFLTALQKHYDDMKG